ncbi:hypothetical protein LH425_08830 [Laribacter hongkongensis]|uniref:surface-adhesin E family protein n=1 Tax=Laribacter hongkongensis TaxID=168471 RepID=UPI001B45ED8B|nr:surface-adhesin E family protein [Laribacter hongkongensis]MBP8813859.1 hypothetical protein [Laribacter sp.]MBP9527358.1 hypothetical protein [Laribacter sp.]MBP9607990.1 hypothetical protein [Laribacter sp.]MCG9065144.1 hypothetical protein [Laribacter hongkongensis]
MIRTLALATVVSLFAAGCASQTAPGGKAPGTRPGPQDAEWKNLGVTPNGNVMNEIDMLSVKKSGQQVTFRDRKTIFNLKKENFGDTPRHKQSVNTWQIDCQARTYRLTAMQLFDENGRQIGSYSYNDRQIKPAAIIPNSASWQQMQVVCK